eukprot:CAMPEP_0113873890 /NCGR_PEP_ID=MMETSP0780_2-20120614/4027_1 /TAXON_ID=652834 /ORGANISM="Palpitomonas bilix" /LENGTH=105 /DNA_ID=CAMNT_0000859597 /DNA_START=440 /DNA_END=753 /DNA_ORIENTATION=+ /assembly_acc=CAM_ASM_000599
MGKATVTVASSPPPKRQGFMAPTASSASHTATTALPAVPTSGTSLYSTSSTHQGGGGADKGGDLRSRRGDGKKGQGLDLPELTLEDHRGSAVSGQEGHVYIKPST